MILLRKMVSSIEWDYKSFKWLKFEVYLMLQSDVNTVCFADETGNLIYSGSDDTFCKVNLMLWDQLHFSTLIYGISYNFPLNYKNLPSTCQFWQPVASRCSCLM
jgi:hypothetical protein